jgi:hypothetical protein
VLFFSLSSLSDAPIVEHQIADDGWVEVPLDFTFPFYGNSYVTSFMFSNGVVGFLDPNNVPGTGYIHDGLCCDGQNFESGATGVRFNYTIMPWHTDLIDAGAGRFYTQGDSTYQKYMWENLAEYYDRSSENSFDLTIYPLGNIEINYTELDIDNHSVTVAIVGDLSAGEYEQWFYNHPTNGAIFWNNTEDDPVIIDEGESICSVVPDSHLSCLYYPETYADAYYEEQCNLSSLYDAGCVGYWDAYTDQQCGLDSLWSNACPNFETAYLDQQCETNPTYSVYCRGYEEAVAEEEIEFEEAQLEEIFVLPPPEIYIEIELPDLIEFEILVESYEVDLPEIAIEEITEQQIIAEIEAEIEEFFEPLPEIEPEPEIEELVEEPVEEEPIEEPIEEVEEVEEEPETEEIEEDGEEEQQEQQPEEQEEVQVAVVKAEPKESTKKEKADSKKDKMREIITNKLNNLAKEMGAAVSLEEQKNLQSYILALLNFNAGFNDYKGSLVDGTFYEDKDIYLNKTIPDNQRGLRNGLANQILHNKLVDLQWQK